MSFRTSGVLPGKSPESLREPGVLGGVAGHTTGFGLTASGAQRPSSKEAMFDKTRCVRVRRGELQQAAPFRALATVALGLDGSGYPSVESNSSDAPRRFDG